MFMSWGTSTQTSLAVICLVMNLCKYVMNIHCLLQIKNYYLIALSHASAKAHGTTSWLDHCVTSVTGLDNIESVTVIDEYICSDHLPLRVGIRCDLATNHYCVSGRNKNDFIDWKTAGVHDYDKFDVKSSAYLSNVDVTVSLFNCTDQSCKLHEGEIDRLYGGIIKSLNMAANDCIPRRKSGTR